MTSRSGANARSTWSITACCGAGRRAGASSGRAVTTAPGSACPSADCTRITSVAPASVPAAAEPGAARPVPPRRPAGPIEALRARAGGLIPALGSSRSAPRGLLGWATYSGALHEQFPQTASRADHRSGGRHANCDACRSAGQHASHRRGARRRAAAFRGNAGRAPDRLSRRAAGERRGACWRRISAFARRWRAGTRPPSSPRPATTRSASAPTWCWCSTRTGGCWPRPHPRRPPPAPPSQSLLADASGVREQPDFRVFGARPTRCCLPPCARPRPSPGSRWASSADDALAAAHPRSGRLGGRHRHARLRRRDTSRLDARHAAPQPPRRACCRRQARCRTSPGWRTRST